MKITTLSVIIPFYNEKENLTNLHQEIVDALSKLYKLQIIYVDDGSIDGSSGGVKKIIDVIAKPPYETKLIILRKNFGQTSATLAGVQHATGDIVSFLDADLQNDPKDIPLLIKKMNEGFEAVVGWRKDRHDSYLHNFTSKITNDIVRHILKIPLHDAGCSLKVIRRDVIKDMKLYGEYHRLIAILLYWRGVSIAEMEVTHRPRTRGSSKYSYFKIFKFIMDLITVKFFNSYGTKPTYIFGMFGFLFCFLSIPIVGVTFYEKVFQGIFVHRNPLFLIAIFLFLLGIQLVFMGLLAELLVRVYFESQNKSIYEVKKVSDL